MRQLSEREARFASLYIETGGNAKEAAIQAGYGSQRAASVARELLARPRVIEKLGEYRLQLEQKFQCSREKMLKDLEEIAKEARDGQYTNYAAILKAKEMQCKMLGYFEPDKDKLPTEYNVLVSES